MAFVTASPTPRHCVDEAIARLRAAKFRATTPEPGSKSAGFAARDGSLIAWRTSKKAGPTRVITAHTDSPNLRIKPRPDTVSAGAHQLGVEVYGGALVNSWLDRDLGLAGQVITRPKKKGTDVASHLISTIGLCYASLSWRFTSIGRSRPRVYC